jgi:predicted phosphodiesterase
LDLLSIRGNQDRAILTLETREKANPTLQFARDALDEQDLEWLTRHVATADLYDGRIFLCHGTPERDDVCLAEHITERGVALKTAQTLTEELAGMRAEVILCGHSHVPRALAFASGRLLVNPGSVGLPAYTHDVPYRHAMESGSPHARYAILTASAAGWNVDHIALAYDWERAAQEASRHERSDWAEWLRTGRASA